MQDDLSDITMTPMKTSRGRRSGGALVLLVLLAFLLGAGLAGYLAWHGDVDRFLPRRPATVLASPSAPPAEPVRAPPNDAVVGSMETRLALLEERFSRVTFAADAASGNAARAEGLLIVSAARRLIDRGEPLGYVSDQLRLRFADAQPNAVDTIVAFAKAPVTVDQLSARLEALSPDLTNTSQALTWWERLRLEVAGLFIVRSDSSTLLAPAARIQRARLMLASGRTGAAIDEVRRLPGADHADKWMEDARRYEAVQRALDLAETTAMLEPRKLKDGIGQTVEEPSPLSTPGPAPTIEAPVAESSSAAPAA